eukprot:PhF_6_TR41066/c0_g1_i2/m.62209
MSTYSIVERKFGADRPKPTKSTLTTGQGCTVVATLTVSAETTPPRVIECVYGDLTKETTDAIVNAANSKMRHGNGLAKAIVKAAGPIINTQCEAHIAKNGLVPTGACIVTAAGSLPCKHVIHAVGPIFENNEALAPNELKQTITSILHTAESNGMQSISVPAISSGLFKFPKDLCAHILIGHAQEFLLTSQHLNCVRMVNFDEETVQYFEREIRMRSGEQ